MGSSYSIIGKLSLDGRIRYTHNLQYTNFQTEATDTLCIDSDSLDNILKDGKDANSLYDLLSLSENGPEAIFLYTNKWKVLLEGRIYDLDTRIQRNVYWFSNLLAESYSIIGIVQPLGDITYIYALFPFYHNDIADVLQLQELQEVENFIQPGNIKPIQGTIYEAPRIGSPKTVSSLYHLLSALGEAPILLNMKQEWIFLFRDREWQIVYNHSLISKESDIFK